MSGPPPPSIEELAAELGLDPADARPLRDATRQVLRFPAAGVLTFASSVDDGAPHQEVAVGRLLAAVGVPATRPRGEPVRLGSWWVTVWHEIPDIAPDPRVGAADLGRLAARLHAAARLPAAGDAPAVASIRTADPIDAARRQLASAERMGHGPESDLADLASIAASLEPRWRRALDGARPRAAVVVHGDLHTGNVVVGRDGPVLVDLELAGWGPPAYDAAPTVALVRWYGRPGSDLAAFDRAYGDPLAEQASADGLDEVWALWSTAWSVANRHRSPEADEEAAVRVETLRTGTAPRPWRLR